MMIPVYIPTRKITILSPKPLHRLAFGLNYKGLVTSKLAIEDDVAIIQLQSFETFRRYLASLQQCKTPEDAALWEWLTLHATIELVLDHVGPDEPAARTNQPYLPVIKIPTSEIDALDAVFRAAKF